MSSSNSASSIRSIIVLLITLIVVSAVLIYFSAQKPVESGAKDNIIASKRGKVDMKALYEAAGTTSAASSQAVPDDMPVAAAGAVKKSKPVAKKGVSKQTGVGKRVAKKAVKKLPTPKEIKAAMPTGKKPWAINMASFSSEPPARALARELYKAGYNTYVTDFMKDGVRWYRVRVGFFTSRDDAVKFGTAIARKLRIGSKPWPVRPQWGEISEHITKKP